MMKNQGYFAYQLRELMKQHQIASVFTDPQNQDDFIAGYVRAVSPKTCLLESVGPYGRADGWFGIRLSAIIEVQHDPVYSERLTRMLRINDEQLSGVPDSSINFDDGDSLSLLLSVSHRRGRVVTCWTEFEAYSGFVDALDDLHVSLVLLDFLGQPCGIERVALMDIELVSICSEEELMFEKLNAFE